MRRTKQMEQWVQRNLAHQAEYGYGLYSVIHNSSGLLIGYCGLEHITLDRGLAAELGTIFAATIGTRATPPRPRRRCATTR